MDSPARQKFRRLGVCHLAGVAKDPAVAQGTVTAAWGGPHVLVGWRLPLDRVLFSLGVELTYISLPVSGRVSGDAPHEIDELLPPGSAGLGLSLWPPGQREHEASRATRRARAW